MNLKILYLKYIKRKKANKIRRIYLGDPRRKLQIDDHLEVALQDVIILGDMLGIGTSDGWAVDLRRILFDISKRVFDEKYLIENLPKLVSILTDHYIIEEVTHHLGEHHQNENEDWCEFLLIYS